MYTYSYITYIPYICDIIEFDMGYALLFWRLIHPMRTAGHVCLPHFIIRPGLYRAFNTERSAWRTPVRLRQIVSHFSIFFFLFSFSAGSTLLPASGVHSCIVAARTCIAHFCNKHEWLTAFQSRRSSHISVFLPDIGMLA